MYVKWGKRFSDILLSLFALILLSPIMIIVAVLIRIYLGDPVIFNQTRPGKGEKVFSIYKFRTMTDQRDSLGMLLPDELRLTGFGRALRATSLDELPELINILKGDMSIIGPRPLLIKYLPLYNQHQRRRHEVRPGLSGLAQINGRNQLNWKERLDLDVEYVDSITAWLDIKIMCMTLIKAFKREGISGEGAVTMPEFRGNIEEGFSGCSMDEAAVNAGVKGIAND
ncbi:MAG: sugar transferase [Syntrophomonas sp.]